jgi:predicted RNA-binding protein YlxR (DUF448 family)
MVVRIVRTPDSHVIVDPSRKAIVGVRTCARAGCFDVARQRRRLDAALKVTLQSDDYDRLRRDFDELLGQTSDSNTGR